ncbi:hypothetical protein TELCIR_24993, partial [Teladorsagia circumcincta]
MGAYPGMLGMGMSPYGMGMSGMSGMPGAMGMGAGGYGDSY